MKASPKTGLIGGLIGGLAVVLAIDLLVPLGVLPKAPFTAVWQSLFGGGWVLASVLGGLLYLAGGALWGVLFAMVVPNPSVIKGVLFGLLPSLWQGTVVAAAVLGEPLFFGFQPLPNILGLIANCVIWGSIVGWYCARHRAAPAGRRTTAL